MSTLEAGVVTSRLEYCGCEYTRACCWCWLKSVCIGIDVEHWAVGAVDDSSSWVVDATECAGLIGVVLRLGKGVPGITSGVWGGGISSWDELSDWFADWLLRVDWLSCAADVLWFCFSFGLRWGFFLGGALEMQFWQYHLPRGYFSMGGI